MMAGSMSIRTRDHRFKATGKGEAAMWSLKSIKEIIRILMDSRCYFDLDLRERHILIKYLLGSDPAPNPRG